MTIAVLADEVLKQELLIKDTPEHVEIIWADSIRSLTMVDADAYMDLQFENDKERTAKLKQLLPKPVLVNSVAFTTKEIGAEFIRINAWPTLLQRDIHEVVIPENTNTSIFDQLNWQYQVVPDIPGMISARVIAMIVNEAYYTLGADVSSKKEIDIAMKLGTGYPYGPFEWSTLIGLKRINELLVALSKTDQRYAVAPALSKEL